MTGIMNEDEAVEPQPEPIQLQPRVETKNIKKGKKIREISFQKRKNLLFSVILLFFLFYAFFT